MPNALEHVMSSLESSFAVGKCLGMVGHKSDDRFNMLFGVNEKMNDSIYDLFSSLVVSKCISLI